MPFDVENYDLLSRDSSLKFGTIQQHSWHTSRNNAVSFYI